MKGHLPVVQYLMETKNTNVNAEDLDGNTPLKLASLNNHTDVVSYIVGVDGGTNGTQGNNDVLILEALKGNIRIVMTLLNKTNNKNYQDKEGRTVLIAAAEGGHGYLVSILLKESEIDVNKATKNEQMTALHYEALN